MKLIYMECTLALLAEKNVDKVNAMVATGTIKAIDNVPYLLIEIPE